MKVARIIVAPILLFIAWQATGAEGDRVRSFIDGMAGRWAGRTVQSPAGVLSYDIDFRASGDCIEGTAMPGGTHHRWRFCAQDGALTLWFLSDFRGNDEPFEFLPAVYDGDGMLFQSTSRDFLRVAVEPGTERSAISIFHGERLHVLIELTREGVCHGETCAGTQSSDR